MAEWRGDLGVVQIRLHANNREPPPLRVATVSVFPRLSRVFLVPAAHAESRHFGGFHRDRRGGNCGSSDPVEEPRTRMLKMVNVRCMASPRSVTSDRGTGLGNEDAAVGGVKPAN